MKLFSSDNDLLVWLCESGTQVEMNDDNGGPYVVRSFWKGQGNNSISHITAKRISDQKIAVFNWSCIEKIVLIDPKGIGV